MLKRCTSIVLINALLMSGLAYAGTVRNLNLSDVNAQNKNSHLQSFSKTVSLDSQCDEAQFNLPKSLMVKASKFDDAIIQSNVQFHRGLVDPYIYQSSYNYNQVKGKLQLNTHWLCKIVQNSSKPTLWLMPTIAMTSGSGSFYYLDVDQKQGDHFTIAQELFLGDRIAINSLVYKQNSIELSYKQHTLTQAMSDQPSELITRHFSISEGKLVEHLN
ncbi:hypothetical protein A9264_14600 [Vibrio sp. UCD-FRSSP16_10]|uniref:hypothetical protein n=1 Tax=unclassified Vibrio TaxID=2614977 RepID=UPI0007FF1159|nr:MULTISPECIES: hypothetical protein [unclassified Vibrio]OBT09467.1 hypothetical protein A9260_06485 [Vibrio sp. UCD-FRSSP16_30]OBT19509.1 hypothetical protein A9264_14600 [Vibrio sp. UCD-FRSSP16_10]